MQKRKDFWSHTIKALKYKLKQPGVEISKVIPSKEDAKDKLERHGISTSRVPICRIIPKSFENMKIVLHNFPFSLKMDYPLVGGYSDIFLITNKEMPLFCQYCGAFAATKLFVEIAIPTSLYLVADKIKLDQDVKLKRGDIWNKDIEELQIKYMNNLDNLLSNYPKDLFFLHPVKLSKWKFNN